MGELHFSLVYLLVKLHFFLIFLLTKLHFSLFWLLGKLHFFLISKFRGILPSYFRKWRNGETENARKTRWRVARGNVWTVRSKDFLRCKFVQKSKHFSRYRDFKGRKGSKICATLHEKRKTPKKYKKEPRARRAISPFIPIRFSRVHTFPPNPTQFGFKVW